LLKIRYFCSPKNFLYTILAIRNYTKRTANSRSRGFRKPFAWRSQGVRKAFARRSPGVRKPFASRSQPFAAVRGRSQGRSQAVRKPFARPFASRSQGVRKAVRKPFAVNLKLNKRCSLNKIRETKNIK
jgi:hypothetical protein